MSEVIAVVGNTVTENEVEALLRGFLSPPPRTFVVSTVFGGALPPLYATAAQAVADALLTATALAPVAIRFVDTLTPSTVDVNALAAAHIYVTDIAGSVLLDPFFRLLRGDAVNLNNSAVALNLNNLRVAINLN